MPLATRPCSFSICRVIPPARSGGGSQHAAAWLVQHALPRVGGRGLGWSLGASCELGNTGAVGGWLVHRRPRDNHVM